MAELIKDCTEKYQVLFSDNYVAYQETEKKGFFSKERVVAREGRIPYSNIAYVEFNKGGVNNGYCRQLQIIIGLKSPQPEFNTMTVTIGLDGCFMDYEVSAAEKLAKSKIS